MSQAHYGKIIQLGYLVDDLDAGIQHWIDQFGVGPWLRFDGIGLDGHFDGEPTSVTINVAMGYQGDLQIELIEVTSDSPSPYLNPDGTKVLGSHHIAWLVDDLDVAILDARARGMNVRFIAGGGSVRVAYGQMPDSPGAWFEFIENPHMAQMMQAGIAETKTWDGSNPIRSAPGR